MNLTFLPFRLVPTAIAGPGAFQTVGFMIALASLVASATFAPEPCLEAWAATPLARTTTVAANATAATRVRPTLLLCTAISFSGGNCCSIRRDTGWKVRDHVAAEHADLVEHLVDGVADENEAAEMSDAGLLQLLDLPGDVVGSSEQVRRHVLVDVQILERRLLQRDEVVVDLRALERL